MPIIMAQSYDQSQQWKSRIESWQIAYEKVVERALDFEKQKKPDDSNLHVNTLSRMLGKLGEFGATHYDFFYQGLFGNPPYTFLPPDNLQAVPKYAWLESTTNVPGEFILETVLRRLYQDLRVIDQALDQRVIGVKADRRFRDWDIVYNSIQASDKLATHALRIIARELISPSFHISFKGSAITYRRLGANIRVVPYSDIGLIAIPTTVLTESGISADQLAIPHEIGHYLYWNAFEKHEPYRLLRKSLANQLEKSNLNPNYPWLEEMFADVVGALLGGPAAAISLQDRMRTTAGEYFRYDDGAHPAPIIRPLIYAHVFSTLKEFPALTEMGSSLADSWRTEIEYLLNQPIITKPASFSFAAEGLQSSASMSEDTVEDRWTTTQSYVNEILKLFTESIPQPMNPWYIERNSAQLVYDAFLEQKVSSLPTIFDGEGQEPKYWSAYIGRVLSEAEMDATWLPAVTNYIVNGESSGETEPHDIPAEIWLTILDAGGWTTGPGGPSNVH